MGHPVMCNKAIQAKKQRWMISVLPSNLAASCRSWDRTVLAKRRGPSFICSSQWTSEAVWPNRR